MWRPMPPVAMKAASRHASPFLFLLAGSVLRCAIRRLFKHHAPHRATVRNFRTVGTGLNQMLYCTLTHGGGFFIHHHRPTALERTSPAHQVRTRPMHLRVILSSGQQEPLVISLSFDTQGDQFLLCSKQ